MPGNDLVQSLARGLDLLRLLAESDGGLRIAELAVATGLKRPTVHNLLRTLGSRDFVVKDGPLFRVGPGVYLLVANDAASVFLGQAEEAVRFLAKRLPRAIVSFCEPVGGEMVVRFRQFPDRMLMERNSGAVLAPYQTASGLALLAYADPETRHCVQLRHPFEVSGQVFWGSEAKFEEFLAEIRRARRVRPPFGADSRYKVAGVPHLAPDGRLVGVLGAAWHVLPDTADETEDILAALAEADAQLARGTHS
jgi:DNA-binding IclR family transcriptional regulator